MRILYVTTIGRTTRFFEQFIRELIAAGHQVDFAANEEGSAVPEVYREIGCQVFHAAFSRSPLSSDNLKAIKSVRKIVSDGNYDIVHCHTPVASLVTRLACRKLRKKTGLKVFYTAHGFHFYKGVPFKNWMIYFPLEWLCSFYTDTLITINKEDYDRAQKRLHAKRTAYVPGVGIDVERFAGAKVDRAAKRAELGIPEDAFLLISVGELNRNKNHEIVIRALAKLRRPDIHYMIAGKGPQEEHLRSLANESGIGDNFHLLGYRHDIPELYKTADADVFPSIREGLGLAALEGMAAGLPLICSDNRGTREYALSYNVSGFDPMSRDENMFAASIENLADHRELCEELSRQGQTIAEKFSVKKVNIIMYRDIYGI